MGFLEIAYGKDALPVVQHYIHFQKRHHQGIFQFLLLLNLSVMIALPYCFGLSVLLKFFKTFTNWTLLTTIAHFVFCLQAARDQKVNQKAGLLASVHCSFETAFLFNFITMSVYWNVIHPTEIVKYTNKYEIFYMYYSHIVPGLTTFLNFALLDIRFKAGHSKPLIVISFIYGFVNYYITKQTGKPVYDFLHWEDYTSHVIFLLMILVFFVCYMTLVKVSFMLKPPKKQMKEN